MRACLFRRRIFGRYQKVLHGGQQGNTHPWPCPIMQPVMYTKSWATTVFIILLFLHVSVISTTCRYCTIILVYLYHFCSMSLLLLLNSTGYTVAQLAKALRIKVARSQVRLDFLIGIILAATLWPWGLT
jgi:hypothetical protein